MSAVHLCVVELQGDGQGGAEPMLAVSAPHYHRVAELFGVLVDNAVEFGLYHCRRAYNHIVLKERALALRRCLGGEPVIFFGKLVDVGRERYIARVYSALAVVDNDVDGYAVVFIKLALLGQQVELLYLACSLAYAPAEQGIELGTSLLACFQRAADIECPGKGDHWHG